MPVTQRLSSPADIRAVFATRRSVSASAVTLHFRSRDDAGPARFTVVAGRRVGSAVLRNRAKRRLREALRTMSLPAGYDVVAVARPAAVTVTFERLVAEVRSLVARLATTLHAAA